MMNPQRIFLIFVLILSLSSASAQSQWKPWMVVDGGPLWGSEEVTGDIRLQGGMRTNGWHLGAGASYDPYRFHSIPVYAQGRKFLGNRKSKPFILGSIGVNISTEDEVEEIFTPSSSSFWQPRSSGYTNGVYAEGGVGWAFRTTKKWGLNLSLSYTHKTSTEKYRELIWAGPGQSEEGTGENKYLMNRLAFRLGLQL